MRVESDRDTEEFRSLVKEAERRLVVALTAAFGPDLGVEATAEALAYLWEHRERVMAMENPFGYLYRVGQSRARRRFRQRRPLVPNPPATAMPRIEPALMPALRSLSQRQRQVVVLVHGFQHTQHEVADLLGISRSSVQQHLERGLARLREALGAEE